MKRRRDTTRWTPLQDVTTPEMVGRLVSASGGGWADARIYLNSRYQVALRRIHDHPLAEGLGVCVHLSIKRLDKAWIHDWRDLQRIKSELLGPEVEAVELYPAESRLVDEANQYHLWAYPDMPAGTFLPIGWHGPRQVATPAEAAELGARQRPLETGP